MNNNLNSRQHKFCFEYATGETATQAYLNAGYHPKSRKNAGKYGYELLQKPKVDKEWKRIKNVREARTQALRNTIIGKALDILHEELSKLEELNKDIREGKELTKDQGVYYKKMMSIVSQLVTEKVEVSASQTKEIHAIDYRAEAEKVAQILNE